MSTALRPAPAPARRQPNVAPRREAERPPLLVVPPRYRRRRAGVVAGLVVLTLFSVMLGLVAFQTRLAQGQLRLDRLDTQTREQQLRYDRLRGQVAVLESPANVVAAARAQGMVAPTQIRYVAVPPAAVASLAAATGLAEDGEGVVPPTGTPGTSDWSTVKPIVGGAP